MIRLYFCAFVALLTSSAATADTYDSGVRTSTFKISSSELDEEREIFVRLPPDYDPSESYSVVYVLDGEWNFDYVASYLDYMADNQVYPPLIVTGAHNVNRNRDYVPRIDNGFADTGEADNFLGFVENEWIAQIESRYPASGARILIGHSFGGVFTLHTFFKRPELFNAYIALGSSAWISDRVLFEEAAALFESDFRPEAFVYMAVGENDGGPTIPSGKDLASLFEQEAPENLEWHFEITRRTDHFSNFISGAHEGFLKLFPSWGFDDEVRERAVTGGAAGVKQWFAEKEEALGYRFKPAWFDLGVVALSLARDENTIGAALALMKEMRRHYPDNAFAALYSAIVYERAGDISEAESETLRALDIVQRDGLDPNEMHIESLERRLSRLREKAAAQ